MKRFYLAKNESVEMASVEAFLEDVHEVCKKHGMCIEHEDAHGSFIVSKYEDDDDFDWLNNAMIGEDIEGK